MLTLGFFVLGLNSCATIMHGTKQAVNISSNPSDALVWVDKNFVGKTPVVVKMTRGDNHIVKIELKGYLPYEIAVSKHMSGWVFGNLVIGGFIGVVIDAVSGGIYTLSPEQIQSELHSGHMKCVNKSGDVCICVTLKADPSWEKIGNLIAVNTAWSLD